MSSYLKGELSNNVFGTNSYDVYNPFSPQYPKPFHYSNYESSQNYLARDLIAKKDVSIEQLLRQKKLIENKQKQLHGILYNENNKNLMNGQNTNLANFSSLKNPFLEGQSEQLKELKLKHLNAKNDFLQHYERQNQCKNRTYQNQINVKQLLNTKQFKSLTQLKNLEEYRNIKEADKIKRNSQVERKSLMNVDGNKSLRSGLFSFANQQMKKLKIDSKFYRSNQESNTQDSQMRMTFNNNLAGSKPQGFIQANKRPPLLNKTNEARNVKQRMISGEYPITIKYRNKVFYSISV